MSETWNKLAELNENAIYDYENDTDLTLEELESIDWIKVGGESSKFSGLTAITYTNKEETLAKKVFSDGFVEYYEIAK